MPGDEEEMGDDEQDDEDEEESDEEDEQDEDYDEEEQEEEDEESILKELQAQAFIQPRTPIKHHQASGHDFSRAEKEPIESRASAPDGRFCAGCPIQAALRAT
jgi:hypothetical protein